MRYQVIIRSAPATGRNGKYRRPVHVRVVDSTLSEWHTVRRLNDGLKAEYRNVDSRYHGSRSAYGQALASARELAQRLNDEITTSCVI